MEEEILQLATTLGVFEKIDFNLIQSNETYRSKWIHVLRQLKDIPLPGDLMEMDAKKFVNLDLIKNEIHENYTFENTGNTRRQMGPTVTRTSEICSLVDIEIYDSCWRNQNQTHVNLYCRVDMDTTFVAQVPFKDYFYVEMNDSTLEEIDYAFFRLRTDEQRFKRLTFSTQIIEGTLRNVYGYQETPGVYVKVEVSDRRCIKLIHQRMYERYPTWRYFETSVDYISKFNSHYGISGCSVIRLVGLYPVVDNRDFYIPLVRAEKVEPVDSVPFLSKILYFDIEVLSMDINRFPDARMGCPIIQISYECNDTKGVLCLSETPGYEWYQTESQLLLRFSQLIIELDPDILCGYNSNLFDLPYILDRFDELKMNSFVGFSRKRNTPVTYKREKRESKQFGAKEICMFKINGRISMDLMQMLKSDTSYKLSSFSLKNVCSLYLSGENKDDLAYKLIPSLMKTPEGRERVAHYCLKDTILCKLLDKKLMLSKNAYGMTKVLGTILNVTLNRGLVFKLMTKIKQYTLKYNFLIPTLPDTFKPTGSYKGAFVLDPIVGFYESPVCVLDFSSLYPSELISANLSYDTIIFDKEWMQRNPDKYLLQEGIPFLKRTEKVGILCRLEMEMAQQRKAARKKMSECSPGSEEESVYNALQLANKIVMNSLYGLMGSNTAPLPCVEIASTITALGRKHLLWSKQYVEENYHRLTGQVKRARVIYGDTDSIFIEMPGITVAKSIEYGKLLEKHIQQDLYADLSPMVMSYEKIFFPFLITRRKGYSGMKYTDHPEKCKLATTGLALVKRDSTPFCVDTMTQFFKYLFDLKQTEALQTVKDMIQNILLNKVDLLQFKLQKKISKHADAYKSKPPHIVSWERLVKRIGSNEAPVVGEFYEYVRVLKTDKKSTRADDEIIDLKLATERNMVNLIDKEYYIRTFLENTLKDPIKLVYGEKIVKEVFTLSNYSREDIVHASKSNLLGFFGKTSMTTTTNKRRKVE